MKSLITFGLQISVLEETFYFCGNFCDFIANLSIAIALRLRAVSQLNQLRISDVLDAAEG